MPSTYARAGHMTMPTAGTGPARPQNREDGMRDGEGAAPLGAVLARRHHRRARIVLSVVVRG